MPLHSPRSVCERFAFCFRFYPGIQHCMGVFEGVMNRGMKRKQMKIKIFQTIIYLTEKNQKYNSS